GSLARASVRGGRRGHRALVCAPRVARCGCPVGATADRCGLAPSRPPFPRRLPRRPTGLSPRQPGRLRPPSRAPCSYAPRSIRWASPVRPPCRRLLEARHDHRALLRRGPIGLVAAPTLEGRRAAPLAPPPRTTALLPLWRRRATAIPWPPS